MTFDCTKRAAEVFVNAEDPGDKAIAGAVAAVSLAGAVAGWVGGTTVAMSVAGVGAMSAAAAVTENTAISSAVGFAAANSVASASGSMAGQYISSGSFDGTSVAVAAGVGFATGGVAPAIASTPLRAAALGAVANTTQYSLDKLAHGQPTDGGEAVVSAMMGAAGGRLGGTVTPVKHAYWLTGATERFLFKAANFGAGSFTRGFAGSISTNIDMNKVRSSLP